MGSVVEFVGNVLEKGARGGVGDLQSIPEDVR